MNIYIYKKNRINKILSYFSYFLWKKNSRYITPRRIRNLYDTFLSYWSYFNSKKSTISVSHIALDFLHVVFFPRNTIGIVCKKTISDSAAVAFRQSSLAKLLRDSLLSSSSLFPFYVYLLYVVLKINWQKLIDDFWIGFEQVNDEI